MKYALTFFVVALLAVIGLATGHADAYTISGLGGLALGMTLAVKDLAHKVTKALPSGASSTTTDSVDLGHGTTGENIATHEFLLTAPAVTTAMLGDAATIKYDIVTSASSDLSGPTTVAKEILVQTGAGGAGAATNSVRFRLPTNCQRYVGVKATKSASGDASTVSMTLELLF